MIITTKEQLKQIEKYYNLYIKYFFEVDPFGEEHKKALYKMHHFLFNNKKWSEEQNCEICFECLTTSEIDLLERLFHFNFTQLNERQTKKEIFYKSLNDFYFITLRLNVKFDYFIVK